MTRKLLAFGCAMLAVLMLATVLSPADARGGHHGGGGGHHGWGGGGGRSWGGGAHFGRSYGGGPRYYGGGHHGRHFRGRGIYLGAPYYAYEGYYASCSWLRYRALNTGSPYWWNRYYDCIGE